VLAIDLVAAMAPADVLSLCLRAGIDEIRHAELCVRMAQIYSGEQQLPPPGMSSLPDDPERPKLHQALANTMLVSCVSETYATTVLSATRDLTIDPTAQAVLTSIYSDEVMHARLGWSYLRYAIEVGGQGVIDAAAQMLPRALRGVANVVEKERPAGEVTPAVRDHGLMTPAEERVIYSTCVREVLVPGFTALGIPVGSALDDFGDAWARASLTLVALAACTPAAAPARPTPADLPARVAADFERAVLDNKDAYVNLFDFTAVGEYEILLHRYDLNGRLKNLYDDQKAQFSKEDGTPTRSHASAATSATSIRCSRSAPSAPATASAPRRARTTASSSASTSTTSPPARHPAIRRSATTPTSGSSTAASSASSAKAAPVASPWSTPKRRISAATT